MKLAQVAGWGGFAQLQAGDQLIGISHAGGPPETASCPTQSATGWNVVVVIVTGE